MKYIDFKKFTDEQGAQTIYLFEGEDAYFRGKGEELLKTRYVQETTLDFAAFDGTALKGDGIKELVDAWNSFPFISEKRMVRVTEFYPTEKEYEQYLKPLFEKAAIPIEVIPSCRVRFPPSQQPSKQLSGITVTPCGIVKSPIRF